MEDNIPWLAFNQTGWVTRTHGLHLSKFSPSASASPSSQAQINWSSQSRVPFQFVWLAKKNEKFIKLIDSLGGSTRELLFVFTATSNGKAARVQKAHPKPQKLEQTNKNLVWLVDLYKNAILAFAFHSEFKTAEKKKPRLDVVTVAECHGNSIRRNRSARLVARKAFRISIRLSFHRLHANQTRRVKKGEIGAREVIRPRSEIIFTCSECSHSAIFN